MSYGPVGTQRTIEGDVVITGDATGNVRLNNVTIDGDLTVDTEYADFIIGENVVVTGTTTVVDVASNTFINKGTLHDVKIVDSQARFVNEAGAEVTGDLVIDALNADIILEGEFPKVSVMQPTNLQVEGTIEQLVAEAVVTVNGSGEVKEVQGSKKEESTVDTEKPVVSDAALTSDGDNRVNVSFKISEEIDFSKNADVRIAYFKQVGDELVPVKTKSGNDLIKFKAWSGYLNGPDSVKYSQGAEKNQAYSNILPADTLLSTVVDPKYTTMNYVDGEWVTTEGVLTVQIQVLDNAGNESEITTLQLAPKE